MRADWSNEVTLAAFDDGHECGVSDAAEDLMSKLRSAGVRDEDWNGGDVVEVLDTWLKAQGVDTSVYECELCTDVVWGSAEERNRHVEQEH